MYSPLKLKNHIQSRGLSSALNERKNFGDEINRPIYDSTISARPTNLRTATSEINTSSNIDCCFICSVLSSLSKVNCCSKHLALLNPIPPVDLSYTSQMSAAVRDWSQPRYSDRPYCLNWKRHRQLNSSSSSSLSGSQYRQKKQPVNMHLTITILLRRRNNILIGCNT